MSHRSHRRIWRVLSACTRDYQRLRWDIGVGAYFGDHANPARIAITAQIAEDIARREVGRHAASFDTRWVPLAVGNRFFDFSRWAACWSRRDLEGVLGPYRYQVLTLVIVAITM